MAYILTQEDIDRFGLIDAMAGDVATAADLQKMGLGTLPKRDASGIDLETTDIALTALQATNPVNPIQMEERIVQPRVEPPANSFTNITATPTTVTAPNAMMSLLDQPISQDPFENLSRNQRAMLAFAAIKDAGMALQGKEGVAFSGTLEGFRERADMERKRKAVAAQRQMLQQTNAILGAAGTPQEKMELLTQYLMQGAIDPTVYTAMSTTLQNQIDRSRQELGTAEQAKMAIDTVEEMQALIEGNPFLTTGLFGSLLQYAPFTQAAELRDLGSTVRSKMALGALRNLKMEGGATLGSVSEKELALLESDIGRLNENRSAGFVQSQLEKIKNRYESIVRRAYERSENDPTLRQGLDGLFGVGAEAILNQDAPDLTLEQIERLYQ
tara:strand:+ start:172 stop:1326 length:1155 start_codon:yes stop_codon:yes gene_type:complete